MNVPFNKPFMTGKELEYITQAYNNKCLSGNGPFTQKCQFLLEQTLQVPKVLLTTSCTDALEMAAILLNIQPGDEVIVPSFTFVSTINAFCLRGAKPVFVDIRPDTLNLDETKIENLITQRTRAIVPVHYAGIGCEMDRIKEVAKKNSVAVVEDNAHGLFGKYKGQYLGTFGCLTAQSFHETKDFTCGEGGALVINDPVYIERAEIIWEKGTNRSKFFRGEIDKYTWVDIGSSYLPSDLLSAFLYAQLKAKEDILKRRSEIFDYYYQALSPLAEKGILRLPVIPAECTNSTHMFYILLNDGKARDALMRHLQSDGISAIFHYLPLHLAPIVEAMGYKPGQLPVTEHVSRCLLRLPFYYDLKENEQAKVVKSINIFFKNKKIDVFHDNIGN